MNHAPDGQERSMTDIPEPTIDADPDPGDAAGGVDAPEPDKPETPVTPDVPLSAQVDDDDIPDAIQEPEGQDSEANVEDPSAEPPA
jgi:hypothetical protein